MPSLLPGYEYDIFISYRQKDNKGAHWVTHFVAALKTELEATFKEDISVYFDENPHDGLLDTLGLGLFAVVGCRKALIYGLDPLPAMLLGVLSAVGGGAVRDLLVAQTPRVLREDVYALAALVGAAVVVAGHLLDVPQLWAAVAGIAATVALRLVAARRGWQAPRAPWSDRD